MKHDLTKKRLFTNATLQRVFVKRGSTIRIMGILSLKHKIALDIEKEMNKKYWRKIILINNSIN